MSRTYDAIASQTLTTAAASVTFSNIPQNYTDLRMIIRCQTTHTAHSALMLEFNGSAVANYSCTRLYGNGATATSDRFSAQTGIDVGFMPPSTAGIGTIILDVMSYSNTNVFTTVLGSWETQAGASGSQFVLQEVGLWRLVDAITTMKFTFISGSVVTGSTFQLFGIRAES